LGFVQDLLNTRPIQRLIMPDLLADLESAQRWLDDSLENWSVRTGVRQNPVILSEHDLGKLRDLRADLNALVRSTHQGHGGPLFPSASLAARVGPDGEVLLQPRGEGSRRVGAIMLIESFTAQRADSWRRLKVCRKDRCAVPFYDHSRNNSGVRHDARECGNAVNLRASRARKREAQFSATQPAKEPSANS
jgi:hypothetical protein